MNILVACEFSGIVRDAFRAKGHDAISCDLLPTETLGPHYQGDVLDLLYDGWDAIVAFPPCTHLCASGAKHFAQKRHDGRQQEAMKFFLLFTEHNKKLKCPRVAIENPVGIMSNVYRKPDQIIQPWMFGHGETKATCLWLKGLPPLFPTEIAPGNVARVHRMSPSPERAKERSRTYPGIAQAMAAQWMIESEEVA